MIRKNLLLFILLVVLQYFSQAQNFAFDFNTSGRRTCLVSTEVDLNTNKVKILFLDSLVNKDESMDIYRRVFGTLSWTSVATAIPAGTGHWVDTNVTSGDILEYQIKRKKTWSYQSLDYDAIGYTIACLQSDNSDYKGQMILLVANDIPANLATKYNRLKSEITSDGWFVNELIVPRASSWDSGNQVVNIKNQISEIYKIASQNDKPKMIFILGHVPLPRCGSADIITPDDHNENKGARGCDAYYADIDGMFTDVATYNPSGLATPLAVNLPGDFKWDQDFFPSDIEMAFGRLDFADLKDLSTNEVILIENYLDRLSKYKNVEDGFDMGENTAFHFGYDNSNDGSYRSLPNISTPKNVFQNYTGPNHNEWVKKNGPFKIYMQNVSVPEIGDWQNFGMNATVYASDQSYWGFGDVPQNEGGLYSRIRSLLGVNSKCLVTLWTTTGLNIFHQACTGQSFGESLKTIMNHNQVNQYLEKAPQEYDTQDWWNRTHFAYWGDPTINLYQIAPPTNVSLLANGNDAILQWTKSKDENILGYHVYESDGEFGKYKKITPSFITSNSYKIQSYKAGNWYMVKAVKSITSGCGKFLHTSIGKSVEGNIVLSTENEIPQTVSVDLFPNPGSDQLNIKSNFEINEVLVYDFLGKLVSKNNSNSKILSMDISNFKKGVYSLKFMNQNNKIEVSKVFIKVD
jgi:hypothetical protein